LGGFRELLADRLRGFDVAAVGNVVAHFLGDTARGGQRHALQIVHELGVNVLGAAEHRQPRALRRASDASANVKTATKLPATFFLLMVHARDSSGADSPLA